MDSTIYVIPKCTKCNAQIQLKTVNYVLNDSVCWCHDCKNYVRVSEHGTVNQPGIDTIHSSRGDSLAFKEWNEAIASGKIPIPPNPINVVSPWPVSATIKHGGIENRP
jgi:hypothetical protein